MTGYTNQIQDIPVSDILENMKSLEDGSDVELPEDYDTILWTKGEWVNSGKNDKVLDNPMEVFSDGLFDPECGSSYIL